MRAFRFPLLVALLCSFLAGANAADSRPYLGSWSNGRGETMVITAKTIQFAEDHPVPYRDITRESDDSHFELQILARGEVNAFPGKTLVLACGDDDSMEMTGYRSHDDFIGGGDGLQVVTWFRERDDENDE